LKTHHIVACAVLLLAASSNAFAASFNKSLGIVVGDLTGISFKYWTGKGARSGQNHAYDIGAGWNIGRNNVDIQLKADYVVHKPDLIPVEVGKALFYYGLGVRAVTGRDQHLGVRIPIGINYLVQNEPFDAFLEIAPVMRIFPSTSPDLSIGLGVRYQFK